MEPIDESGIEDFSYFFFSIFSSFICWSKASLLIEVLNIEITSLKIVSVRISFPPENGLSLNWFAMRNSKNLKLLEFSLTPPHENWLFDLVFEV